MTMHTPLPPDSDELDSDPSDESSPACILVFNASDPSGAGGLTGDIATIASVGGHAIAVVTGAYARDTAQIFDHFCLDDEAVAEQARAVLEDLPVQAIKVGFVGSTENISTIAEIASAPAANAYSAWRCCHHSSRQKMPTTRLNSETARGSVTRCHSSACQVPCSAASGPNCTDEMPARRR